MADRARTFANTACPYCSVELDPLPESTKRSTGCGQPIYVRLGPDGLTYLLRVGDLPVLDQAWAEYYAAERAQAARDRTGLENRRGEGMQTSKDEMYHGLVIAESLRADADIQLGEGTRLERVQRVAITHPAPGQPDTWTLLTVSLPARLGSSLVAWLERSLIAGPWYADLGDSTHHYVVFSGRTFRYSLDDPEGPEEARRYGQLLGIPHDQLDWDGA